MVAAQTHLHPERDAVELNLARQRLGVVLRNPAPTWQYLGSVLGITGSWFHLFGTEHVYERVPAGKGWAPA